MVVGAAPLDPEVEAFWGRLGFIVVQGYGLTETAPIVTLNHPFHASRGAVGKPIGGVEVRIADDGEILVRGENVTTGYFNAPEETRAAFRDGWFHTGDIGGLDDQGRLYIRGRKKEMIVTPEGLNVFPEDVERALNDQRVAESPSWARSPGRIRGTVQAIGRARRRRRPRPRSSRGQREPAGSPEKSGWPRRCFREIFPGPRHAQVKRRELRDWLLRAGRPGNRIAPGSKTRAVRSRSSPGSRRDAP